MYCKIFSEEYEKLISLYKIKRNEDLILARLEGGSNPMILSRYGIYRFPLLALFQPESKRIYAIYQGLRTAEQLDSWFDFIAPRIQIKNNSNINNNNNNNSNSNNNNNNNNNNSNINNNDKDDNIENEKNENINESDVVIDENIIKNISNVNQLTEEDEFIKQEFMEIKKRLNNLENKLKIFKINKIQESEFSEKKNNGNKIKIEIDITPISVLYIILFSMIIYALYKTLTRLIKNYRHHIE